MKNSFIYKFIVSGLAIIALVVSVLTHVLPSYAADSYSYTFNARAIHYNGSEEVTYSYVGTFSSPYPICLLQSYSSDYVRYFLVSTTDNTGVTAVIDYADSLGNSTHRTYGYTISSEINSEYGMFYYYSSPILGANCSLGYSFNGYDNLKCFTSFDECANYLFNGVTDGDVSGGVNVEDSSEVPIPEGDLYLNSSVVGDGSNKFYQGIQLTNYDPDYTVVYKTRYTIPTYVTVNATSSTSAKVNVLSYYTSGISLDTCTFNSSSEAYFVFYNKLLTEYQRVYWTDGGLYDLTDDVSLAFYRQDGSLTTSNNAYYEFYGDYDSIVADSSPCVRNVSSPFVGKEIWIAYQITDSLGNTYTSEYQKFIVYPLSSATYNRLLTRYYWDASNIDSGVVYDSTSSSNVGDDTIFESSALISNASGDTNLSGNESGSSNSLNVNVDDVSDAMTSITSLMGNVPVWFAYIFGMFPDWLITLLSIGIAWVIVVGMIKLLKW